MANRHTEPDDSHLHSSGLAGEQCPTSQQVGQLLEVVDEYKYRLAETDDYLRQMMADFSHTLKLLEVERAKAHHFEHLWRAVCHHNDTLELRLQRVDCPPVRVIHNEGLVQRPQGWIAPQPR